MALQPRSVITGPHVVHKTDLNSVPWLSHRHLNGFVLPRQMFPIGVFLVCSFMTKIWFYKFKIGRAYTQQKQHTFVIPKHNTALRLILYFLLAKRTPHPVLCALVKLFFFWVGGAWRINKYTHAHTCTCTRVRAHTHTHRAFLISCVTLTDIIIDLSLQKHIFDCKKIKGKRLSRNPVQGAKQSSWLLHNRDQRLNSVLKRNEGNGANLCSVEWNGSFRNHHQ